jgi:hypothetical protein
MAATNKSLARSNRSRAVGKSTKNSEARLCWPGALRFALKVASSNREERIMEGTAMMAEIFMLRLEAAARAAKEAAATSSRFVPITPPAVKAS